MNKKMDPFATKPKKKTTPQYNNFLEAFKDIGSSTVKSFAKDVIAGTAKNAVDTLTGKRPNNSPTSTENFDFEEMLKARENQVRQQERARFNTIKKEETVIFSRQQQEVKLQIESILTQIKAMSKEQVGLMQEINKASFAAVVNPGVYHKNFFERLMSLISLARKSISESKSWLSLHNARSKQKGYWGNVKKSGTSYMLSSERSTVTQTG